MPATISEPEPPTPLITTIPANRLIWITTPSTTTMVGYLVYWNGIRYAPLADFSSATGQETRGLSVDPGFRNPAQGDYRLSGNSTLINAGQIIAGINSDYRGAEPDIGAYEETSHCLGAVYLLLLGD